MSGLPGEHLNKPPFGKVKRTITIDPILWNQFTRLCFNNETKYSTQIAILIQKYVINESGKMDT